MGSPVAPQEPRGTGVLWGINMFNAEAQKGRDDFAKTKHPILCDSASLR